MKNIKDYFEHRSESVDRRIDMNHDLNRITYRELILWTLLVFFIFVLVYVGYLTWWPYNPIRVDGIKVCQSEVRRGEVIYFTFKGEKFMNITSHITIELVNGERMLIMSYDSNTPPGEAFKKRSFIVPYHIQPGRYQLVWTGVYNINPIRDIIKTTKSDFITITDEEPLRGLRGFRGEKGKDAKNKNISIFGTQNNK
jgi:hypothetical protein